MAEWYDAPVGTRVPTEGTGAPAAGATGSDMVAVVYPNGTAGTVPRSQLEDEIISKGARLEGEAETEARATQKRAEGHQVDTGIRSFASAATLGGTDLLAGALSPEYAQETRERREANMAGNIVGGVAGALTPWGAGGLATGAGRAAEAAVAARAGTGLGGRLAAAGVRGAAEGGIFGAGMGVSEVGLTPGPVSWESAAVTIGSNALGGAGLGAGIGVGAKLLEEGAVAAKGFAQRQLEAARAPEATAVDRSAFPEIASMDKRAAREALAAERETVRAQRATDLIEGKAAREVELAEIGKAKDAAARDVYEDVLAYKDEMRAPGAFVPTSDRELATQLKKSKRSIMTGLDNDKAFVRSRGSQRVVDGLETQEKALTKVLGDADEVLAGAEASQQALLDGLPTKAGRGRLPSFASLPEDTVTVTATARELEQAGLYELPGAGTDAVRMERARAGIGKPEAHGQPIRMTMDDGGRLFIEDGRHRIRSALEEGGERELSINIDRGVPGWHAGEGAVSLGKPSQAQFYLTPEQSQLYANWSGTKIPKGQSALAVGAEEMAGFRAAIESGDVQSMEVQRVLGAQQLLDRNQALQARIAELRAPAASPRLAELDAKLEAARAGVSKTPRLDALEAHLADLSEETFGKKVARHLGGLAGGSVGSVGGFVGAMAGREAGAEMGARVYDRLVKKIQTGNTMRAKSIAASVGQLFAEGGERVAKAATKAAPLASKILPSIRYAPPEYVNGVLGPANERPSKTATVTAFRERARELNALTERRPDGGFTVRMPAREALNERLQALWAIDPEYANGVEKTHNARLEFLASKLPRNPAPPHLQVGPDAWEPSSAEVAKFARYMEAVEQPERVLQRMAIGTMTPEDAEVLKGVYPNLYQDARQQIEANLAQARALPYQKRLALSIYMDVAADPAVTPEAITVYQGMYEQQAAQAPGGMPGAPAPPPRPFTSSEKPTRAQRQAEG